MRLALFLMAAGFVLLAGCAVGPDYQVPKTATPAHWTAPLAAGETNQSSDLAQWWQNFGDTNLNALIATAVQSNLTLHVAEAHVREARAERDQAAGYLWPTVDANGSYSRNRFGRHAFPPVPAGVPLDYNLYSAGFDAAWELDVFGGIRRSVEAANAEIGTADAARHNVLLSLLAEVARNYIEARGYQQRLAITRQNIQVQRDVLDLTKSRYQSGLSSDLDVQQATAILTTTESQVPAFETGFQQSVHHLSVLLGQYPGTLLDVMTAEKPIPGTPPDVPVGLPSDLLQRRPDIQSAERELAAATARIGVAKADLYPVFSLTGVAGFESMSAGNWFNYASRYWTAGPTVQWNLFEAGRTLSNIRVQNSREQQALDTYRQTLLVALEDVENALIAYAKEKVRHESLAQSVSANEQAFEISSQLYKSGLADFLQVLDSERALYESQDAEVQSNQAISEDLVQLYKALGGGWDDAPASDQSTAKK